MALRDVALFSVTVFFVVLCIPYPTYGGIIWTKIISRHTVERPGKISIEVEVKNAGNATAYNVVVSLFLAEWVKIYDDLGNNNPGGRIYLKSEYYNPNLKPGRYTLAIRVSFEEQSGRPHRVYHFSRLSYPQKRRGEYRPALSLRLEPPVFNTRGFWGNKGNLKLFLKNGHVERISPSVFLYLPDGFRTYEPNRYYQLDPGEERVDIIPLTMDTSMRNDVIYHAVVWYEEKGVHYSELIKGKIRVQEKPVYFRWYLILSTVCLVLISVVVYYNRFHHRGTEDTESIF